MPLFNKIISWGILLLVFLIPWQARWIISIGQINGGDWEYGTQSVYATEILLAVILIFLIIKFVTRVVETRQCLVSTMRELRKRLYSPTGALLLFLIYAGLSIFWSIDKNTALIHWRFLVESGVVFILITTVGAGLDLPLLRIRNKIQWAIILSAVIQAIWGIGQWLMQSIPASTILGIAHQGADVLGASVIETLDGRWLRAYGSFPHPNILGAWLVLGLVTLVSLWHKESRVQSQRVKAVFISSFIILLFGLLATFSRSAWLALLLLIAYSLLLVFCRLKPWSVIGKIITITALIIIVFVTLFPQPFLTRLNNASRLEYKSTSEREASLSEGWQIIKKHPLLGVGVGNYGLAVHRDIDKIKPAYYYQPTHNVFLLIWAELGLLGLLFIAYSLWLIAFKSRELWLQNAVFLAPLFIIAILDHYLWSLYSGLMIGALYLANISRK